MRGRGLALITLLVGCATGAIARDVLVPARAAGNGVSYSYKILKAPDLVDMGRKQNSELKEFEATEVALNELGHNGWRLVQFDAHEFEYYFESVVGGGAGR